MRDEYPSVGCKSCTCVVQPGENDRAERWSGNEKTGCGLHTDLFFKDVLTSDIFNLNIGK
jgi:3'-phosphoadenosine 5'-phosphosulfate sulfotransferase (PAPS reductase)/FAD synthetase